MSSSQPEAELRQFIASRLPPGAAELTDETELFHMLDSVDMVRIVAVMEDAFDILLEDYELIPENLATINRLLAIARKKQSGS
jgi:acyl carrier protein